MVLGFGHHSQKDPNVAAESRGRDPFIATGRGGAGNVSIPRAAAILHMLLSLLLRSILACR